MSDANLPYYGPITYSPIWTVIALLFFITIVIVIVIIFYLTRHKKVKTIATLEMKAPKVVNMPVLRSKYLKMIDESEERFKRHQIKASQCHQQLSFVVRSFFFEALGFHADIMTLSDLKKSKHKKLAELIDTLYPDEFNTLERGSVADAAERARKIVREQEP